MKSPYTALLQELKELQGKIESAQKDLQQATSMYNQQLEKDNIDPEELTPENLTAIMASVGVIATPAQIQDFAHKLGENVSKRRKCG